MINTFVKFDDVYNEAMSGMTNPQQPNPNQATNSSNILTQKLTPEEIDGIKKNISSNISKVSNADQLFDLLFGSDNTQQQPANTNNQQANTNATNPNSVPNNQTKTTPAI